MVGPLYRERGEGRQVFGFLAKCQKFLTNWEADRERLRARMVWGRGKGGARKEYGGARAVCAEKISACACPSVRQAARVEERESRRPCLPARDFDDS